MKNNFSNKVSLQYKPPVSSHWRLNERHYGMLQGMDKQHAKDKYGEINVKNWRMSYFKCPPKLGYSDLRHPIYDPMYYGVNSTDLPSGESLEMLIDRVKIYWNYNIKPDVLSGKNIMIISHNHVIRGLIMLLKNYNINYNSSSDDHDLDLIPTVPNAIPQIFYLDDIFRVTKNYYLCNKLSFESMVESEIEARKILTSKNLYENQIYIKNYPNQNLVL
eukprot:Mrub_04640.p1 GENE.Mrub_04640~~Mrub_04640.p1  ORF type:complete len:218 (-),score=17.96 Mrub_04640:1-654(-)